MFEPLAERMRPKTLDDYIGQKQLIGEEAPLRQLIRKGLVPSMIFYGPPGTGKTTLAQIIASESSRPFYILSAINTGVKDIRDIIDKSTKDMGLFPGKLPILFIDEIHRFSKSQQDSLLWAIEKGIVTLIGATTENPSFEVISALLSRCQVYVLNPFDENELAAVLERAVKKDVLLKEKSIILKETDYLVRICGGDARKLLNLFEILINQITSEEIIITNAVAERYVKSNPMLYDKSGDLHYDIVSAFIKSIRGSDPNAALYWLARMIHGGEDPKFIARRMLILASEDVGNANPTALVLANTTFQTVSIIGYPEARIVLSQCAIYLACSPKSNSSYESINKAMELVKHNGNLSVPLHLRNAPTKLMKDMGYGKAYRYAHDYEGNFIRQDFFPSPLEGTSLYKPGENAKEKQFLSFLKRLWGDTYQY